jgi:hypothetical protein
MKTMGFKLQHGMSDLKYKTGRKQQGQKNLERLGWEGENPQRVVVPNDDGDDDDDDDDDDVFDGILVRQYSSIKHEQMSLIKVLNAAYIKIQAPKKSVGLTKRISIFLCRQFPMGYFNQACEIWF